MNARDFGKRLELLNVNDGKLAVICHVNGGRMYVGLNGDQLEEVECFKYLGSQVAADL